jgi:hypothetical protein
MLALRNADSTTMRRAAWSGVTPSATGTAIAVENPGGKCASGSVVSAAAQPLVGTRYAPACASVTAEPT